MPKFRKQEKELASHLDYWLYYLKNLAYTENIPKVLQEDEVIKDAFDIAEFLALDKDEQFAYQQDLKTKLDNKNVMDYAKEMAKKEGRKEGIEKGIKEGIKEGRKERDKEIAKNLLDILDIETIALKTGLSIDDIKEIVNF